MTNSHESQPPLNWQSAAGQESKIQIAMLPDGGAAMRNPQKPDSILTLSKQDWEDFGRALAAGEFGSMLRIDELSDAVRAQEALGSTATRRAVGEVAAPEQTHAAVGTSANEQPGTAADISPRQTATSATPAPPAAQPGPAGTSCVW